MPYTHLANQIIAELSITRPFKNSFTLGSRVIWVEICSMPVKVLKYAEGQRDCTLENMAQ